MKSKKMLYLSLMCLAFFGAAKGYRHYEKFHYRPDLTIIGFFEMWDGIGRQSAEIIDALAPEFSVRFWPTRKVTFDGLSPTVVSIAKKKRARLGKVVLYEDILAPQSHEYFSKKFTKKDQDSIKIAYTMFESTLIPDFWVNNLNRFFDAAIVPDPFYVKVYQDSGVKIPIFCLPLGLNLKDFLKEPIKEKRHTPFTFGYFSTCYLRKNHVDLIRAFHKAFNNSPDVKLVINCKSYLNQAYFLLKNELASLKATNIELTTNCYDQKEYLNQFKNIDCYVSLSKSEGFSIQPREAMALGLPVIVSNNTAQTTICQSQLVETVSCPTTEPAFYEIFFSNYGLRFNIDIDEAAQKMQKIYNDYPSYLEKAKERRQWAYQYDYSQLKELYKTIVKPNEVILSSENKIEKGMLFTTSTQLKDKYDKILH